MTTAPHPNPLSQGEGTQAHTCGGRGDAVAIRPMAALLGNNCAPGQRQRARERGPWWLLPGLMVLGLLALGASAVSQHRMLHTTPQQLISARPNSIPPVPADSNPNVSVGKAYLGIRGKTFVQGQVRGVKVLDVFPGSPAARAGLRSDRDRIQGAGHVIIGVDGQPVRSEEDLAQIMARLSAGAQVQLFLTNAMGKTSEVISVTLGTAP